jgi:hypothetical protein
MPVVAPATTSEEPLDTIGAAWGKGAASKAEEVHPESDPIAAVSGGESKLPPTDGERSIHAPAVPEPEQEQEQGLSQKLTALLGSSPTFRTLVPLPSTPDSPLTLPGEAGN